MLLILEVWLERRQACGSSIGLKRDHYAHGTKLQLECIRRLGGVRFWECQKYQECQECL